jgi:hypothetical protein
VALASFQGEVVVRRHFGADLGRVDGILLTMNNVVVDAVLDVRGLVGDSIEPPAVRVVFGEQQHRCSGTAQPALTQ